MVNPIFIVIALPILILFCLFFFKTKKHQQTITSKLKDASSFSATELRVAENESLERQKERVAKALAILNEASDKITYMVPLPPDIILQETKKHLLIKGSVKSLVAICDELEIMELLPAGYCMQLGEWRFFIVEDMTQSSLKDKIVVMPPDLWWLMTCKLKDSIYGNEIKPYNYVFEPFTFKQVLEYGIGVEAIDKK